MSGGSGRGIVDVGERLADRDLGDAGDRDDVARPGLFGGNPVERVGEVQLDDLHAFDRAVDAAPRDLLALAHVCRCARGTARGGRGTATRRGS